MNITEANDLNVVLRHMLQLPAPGDREDAPGEALAAAQRLADRANRALGAGLDGPAVAAAWPDEAVDELAAFLDLPGGGFKLYPWQRRLISDVVGGRKSATPGPIRGVRADHMVVDELAEFTPEQLADAAGVPRSVVRRDDEEGYMPPRPTEDPGDLAECPVCGQRLPSDPWPGCYWGKFRKGWVCVSDTPMLGRGA